MLRLRVANVAPSLVAGAVANRSSLARRDAIRLDARWATDRAHDGLSGARAPWRSKGYLGSARKLPFLPATGAQKTPAHSFKRRRNEHQGSISNSRRSRFEQHSNVLRLVALLPHHAPLPPTETLRLSRALMCRVSVLALKCRTLSERRPMRTAATLTPMLPTGDRRMRTRVACMHAFVVHVVGHL